MAWEFAEALSTAIGRTKHRQIVRRALGHATPDDRVHYAANYIGRILKGEVDSPGIEQLRLIATGLGFDRLSAFFLQLESLSALQNQDLKPGKRSADDPLPPAEQDSHAIGMDAPPSPSTIAALIQRIDAIERSVIKGVTQSKRQRKDSTRPRKKPTGRATNRKDARRRA